MAIGECIGEGGDASVGVDGEEKGLFLGVLRYVDFVGFVGDAGKEEVLLVGILEMQEVCDERKGYGARRRQRGRTQVLRE